MLTPTWVPTSPLARGRAHQVRLLPPTLIAVLVHVTVVALDVAPGRDLEQESRELNRIGLRYQRVLYQWTIHSGVIDLSSKIGCADGASGHSW